MRPSVILFLMLPGLIVLSACTPSDPVPGGSASQVNVPSPEPRVRAGQPPAPAHRAPDPAAPAGDCGAARLRPYLGQPLPEVLVAQLQAAGPVRIVPEGGMMTMDYNPARLTVVVSDDARRIVRSVTCG